MLEAGLGIDVRACVRELILTMLHDALPATPDAARLTRIDLAILAAAPTCFAYDESQIRSG